MTALRKLMVLMIVAAALATLLPDATAQPRPRQGADAAHQGEDNLDDMLRRFGPEYAGLKEKIEAAIKKGVQWLLSKQDADGHWPCYDVGASGYPMGGTAFAALAIKKSTNGMYEGDQKELDREIKKLERLEKSNKITYADSLRLNFLRDHGAEQIAARAQMFAAVEKAIVWLRAKYKAIAAAGNTVLPDGSAGPGYRTYDLGITLMLLEGYYTHKKEVKDGYVMQVDEKKIPASDLDWIKEMVAFLEKVTIKPTYNGKSHPGEGWRYPGQAGDGSSVDNSNTQYAVLGLKAAARMGVHMKDMSLWKAVAEYFLAIQEPTGPAIQRKPPAVNPADGEYFFPPQYTETQPQDAARGWGYLPEREAGHPATGAMTTAALAALQLARSELYEAKLLDRDKEFSDKLDKSISDGMAWLGHYFTVTTNPVAGNNSRYGWHYYYLYGLERAGVLCQTEFFGSHPWYPEGAKLICSQQKADGSWDANSSPAHPAQNTEGNIIADTCFALLFLKRATLPVNAPPVQKPVITGDK
ncbi:MAG: hypothetical protein AB7K09_24350 [Planctomycetota bacterium]